jgi:hypothetical protein
MDCITHKLHLTLTDALAFVLQFGSAGVPGRTAEGLVDFCLSALSENLKGLLGGAVQGWEGGRGWSWRGVGGSSEVSQFMGAVTLLQGAGYGLQQLLALAFEAVDDRLISGTELPNGEPGWTPPRGSMFAAAAEDDAALLLRARAQLCLVGTEGEGRGVMSATRVMSPMEADALELALGAVTQQAGGAQDAGGAEGGAAAARPAAGAPAFTAPVLVVEAGDGVCPSAQTAFVASVALRERVQLAGKRLSFAVRARPNVRVASPLAALSPEAGMSCGLFFGGSCTPLPARHTAASGHAFQGQQGAEYAGCEPWGRTAEERQLAQCAGVEWTDRPGAAASDGLGADQDAAHGGCCQGWRFFGGAGADATHGEASGGGAGDDTGPTTPSMPPPEARWVLEFLGGKAQGQCRFSCGAYSHCFTAPPDVLRDPLGCYVGFYAYAGVRMQVHDVQWEELEEGVQWVSPEGERALSPFGPPVPAPPRVQLLEDVAARVLVSGAADSEATEGAAAAGAGGRLVDCVCIFREKLELDLSTEMDFQPKPLRERLQKLQRHPVPLQRPVLAAAPEAGGEECLSLQLGAPQDEPLAGSAEARAAEALAAQAKGRVQDNQCLQWVERNPERGRFQVYERELDPADEAEAIVVHACGEKLAGGEKGAAKEEGLDSEMVQEQEQEEEQQHEAKEVEKVEEEMDPTQVPALPWSFEELPGLLDAARAAGEGEAGGGGGVGAGGSQPLPAAEEHCHFLQLRRFRHGADSAPLPFPPTLLLSRNHSPIERVGTPGGKGRRLKNVTVVMLCTLRVGGAGARLDDQPAQLARAASVRSRRESKRATLKDMGGALKDMLRVPSAENRAAKAEKKKRIKATAAPVSAGDDGDDDKVRTAA